MNQDMSFGSYVRQRRREMDLTQEELARRVGCAAITLRKIEADDLRASVQIAERLAMALAIPLEERGEFVRKARSVRPELMEVPQVTPSPTIEEIGREDLTGRAIRGYALAERIGMGGMGSVYRAVQPNVDREVAVKIILPAFANHPDFIRRFEAEAQLVARLEHPHIVPLYDYWREPGVAYLVMRLLRGGNIQNLLGQGALPIEVTAHMLEQICSALTAAHRIGVIHRDLKPANVLLDDDNNAYLADFGIAKNLGDPDFENQTQVDAMIGSPQYMSPEQIRSLSVRPQTDIYCLGVMLYEMLTGALPFAGPTPFDLIQQHVNTPMPSLSARRAGLPSALDPVITRATAKDPDSRYADAQSLFQEFRQAIGRIEGERIPAIAYEEEDTSVEVANPFKGLRAFGEADADNFFGRETLVQQLLARLAEGGELSRFLGVIGPSGSGKSSVVRAGLIPALRRGGLPGSENWFVVDMLPGKHPFEELEASLLRVAVNPPESLLSQLKESNRGLLRAVHRVLPADDSVQLVLVIDQFEEVFTLIEDETERALLLESLATAVLDERSRLRVIITLRADFTDKPLRYVDFGELLNRRFEFVLPLTADELERAVAGPAQRVGLKLEKGLVSTIIRDTGNQPGALPLLQYALSELYDKRDGRTLTNKAYKEIGGVLGALGRSAETVFVNLDEASQSAARQLFLRLVTLGEGTEDTRRRALREELENLGMDKSQLSKVIDAFGKARLLSFDRDPLTRGATIEVAHEALLREWTRLREWLNESRADVRLQRQLAVAANEWQNAKQDLSFLLTGSRLEQFEGWSANTTVALTHAERAFLDASIAEREKLVEREKRSVMRLRMLNRVIATTGAIALILAIVAGMFGLSSSQNAQQALNAQATSQVEAQNRATAEANAVDERNIAQQQSQIASVRELSSAANVTLEIDPERSILLSLEAVNISLKNNQPVLIEAQDALHRSIQTSRILATLHGHTATVESVVVSPDEKRLATFSDDGTVKIWDAESNQELLSIPTDLNEQGPARFISFSPDGKRLAIPVGKTLVKVLDVASGRELLTLSGHTDEVVAIAFSPDGTRIVTGSWDTTAKLWDAATGNELLTITGHGNGIATLAFSPDGTRLYTASDADGVAIIWDVATGEQLSTFDGEGGVESIAVSPDGKQIATGEFDTTLKIWDAATGNKLLTLFGHASYLNGVVYSPDGKRLASTSEDGTTKLWDAATGKAILTLSGHTSGVENVAFSSDGNRLYTSSRDGTVKIWDISPTAGSDALNLAGHTDRVYSVAYRPDGKQMATVSWDGTVKVWDAISGEELLNLPLTLDLSSFTSFAGGVKYSPNGKWLAYNDGKTTIIVDADSGTQILSLPAFNSDTVDLAFSADGTKLAIASVDSMIRISDTKDGKTLLEFPASTAGIQRIAFSPDGERIASANNDGTYVWDAVTGKNLLTFSGHGEGIRSSGIAYSPDGKWIASSGNDASIQVWDAKTGKVVFSLIGHTGPTFGAAFSPDGQFLATSSVDRTVKIWKLPKPGEQVEEPLTLYGNTGAVYQVAFSPDGTRVVSVGRDRVVRIYELNIDELIKIAKARVTRALTVEECQKYLHVSACPAIP